MSKNVKLAEPIAEKKNLFIRLIETCASLGKNAWRIVSGLGRWFATFVGGFKAKMFLARAGVGILSALAVVFSVITMPSYAMASFCDSGVIKLQDRIVDIKEAKDEIPQVAGN
ncbi:MAG: hypothetical protein WC441_05275 [Patescibacteria group bacterium]